MKKLLVVGVLLLSACSSEFGDTFNEEYQDTGVDERDDTDANIINMPNGYSNVAWKCNGTTGVYVTKNDGGRALSVVGNDQRCTQQ